MSEQTNQRYNDNQTEKTSRNPLINYGFNLRERMNVYGGLAIGVMAPIVLFRGMMGQSNYAAQEAAYWAIAGISSIPQILFTGSFGLVGGMFSAFNLRDQRFKRELKNFHLEDKLNENKEEC